MTINTKPPAYTAPQIAQAVIAHQESQRSRRTEIFRAAMRNVAPGVTTTQAKAEGSTREPGPDKQAVRGYSRPNGKPVADYLRNRPAFPMKKTP